MWPFFLKSVLMSTRYPIPLPPIPECPSPYYSPSPPPIVMRRTSVSGQHGIVGRALTLPPGDQKANPPPLRVLSGAENTKVPFTSSADDPYFLAAGANDMVVVAEWCCVHGN